MNKKKMNVLLIFTDQQRYDTIEALGNPIIKTPVLNKLVENGISFNKAYTPCPVCVGARYSMLTGQLPHRTGCADNEPSVFREITELLAAVPPPNIVLTFINESIYIT